jgi:mono/diheme cytochrome c family protein
MPFVTRKSLLVAGVLSGLAVAVLAGFVWSGIYNIGADDQHTRPVYAVLAALRERSIEARTGDLVVPDLTDPALIRQGAGNYDAMCAGCHLAPGQEATELSRGLYPAPPALATAEAGDPAHRFWVIKHGIKASGMPAWGRSMDDRYLWGMVAFIQQLPTLDAAGYRALVASSAGHSHGGGDAAAHHDLPHEHAPGTPPHVDAPAHTDAEESTHHHDHPH